MRRLIRRVKLFHRKTLKKPAKTTKINRLNPDRTISKNSKRSSCAGFSS